MKKSRNTGRNTRWKTIRKIISYILTLALTVFFALYMNATVGWFMCAALILSFVVSVVFAHVSIPMLQVVCEMDEGLLSKNDTCEMTVTIHNRSLFPTTPIELEIENDAGVISFDKQVLVTLLPFEKQSFKVTFQAKICGPSVVGIRKVSITDYLGILSFPVKRAGKQLFKVAVIPDVTDVSPRNDKLMEVMQASNNLEESEESVECSSYTFGGFPGYESREYTAGDPLKRINWKQSAKRGMLMVRLDDMMSSKTVNVVLDSTFAGTPPVLLEKTMDEEDKWEKRVEYALVAGQTVENTLGTMRTLLRSNYRVRFFAAMEDEFSMYEIEDEKDLETVRVMLAGYSFCREGEKRRRPDEKLLDAGAPFLYCSPDEYKESYLGSKKYDKKQNDEKQNDKKRNDKKTEYLSLLIPYLLSVVSGMTLFSAFEVPVLSVWTLLQMVWCALMFALCVYTGKHKVTGTVFISMVVFGVLFYFSMVAFDGIEYMQWFMSGADSHENTVTYLFTLLLIFTTLFSMVLFYYTQVYYRTGAILLVTMIPYVVYVKLIKEVGIGYVMVAVVLNVWAFLLHKRKQRDSGKKILGFKKGILSYLLYGVCFIMLAIVVPKSDETICYHVFEEWFLGGNVSTPIPDEYGSKNQYSGNADNFNRLTNRQIYNISGADTSEPLYLRRQVYDYYDYEQNRWYSEDIYQFYIDMIGGSDEGYEYLYGDILLKLEQGAEEISPGFLDKYDLGRLKDATVKNEVICAEAEARNFESTYLPTPTITLKVEPVYGEEYHITWHQIYENLNEPFHKNTLYSIRYVDEFKEKEQWISLGGSDIDFIHSYELLEELNDLYQKSGDAEEWQKTAAGAFLSEAQFAVFYELSYQENMEALPQRVKDLALTITEECTYDWEKAEALQDYFHSAGFVYDLEYDAPDDSVEYFLFESKTGTCSDFASAYVLMARAAGLKARYVEGFVPEAEVSSSYEMQYVVRTKDSHAYPEVYIPNLGFVVYEPTVGAVTGGYTPWKDKIPSYIFSLLIRLAIVVVTVVVLVAGILFVARILTPFAGEKLFIRKVKKTEDNRTAIRLLYERLLLKYAQKYMEKPKVNTPYEFAVKFEKITGISIAPLCYLLEKSAYGYKDITPSEREEALNIYLLAIRNRKSPASR